MKPAISVENIAKQYFLGNESIVGQSFREMIVGSIKAPLRKFRRISGSEQHQEKFWALHDISFDVQPGEIVGVIGRNGAGKSTLLKILSRITTPTKGTVTYRGRIASLLEVGTGFHPELTGRENIYLNGAILGMSRHQITARMDDIVEFAEITKFLDTPVKRYSSGMYVRLAFSVAAHLDPDILLVDEVLAVGDQVFQQKCLGKLKDTAGDGRTVLFVSHNMTAVKSLCTRIIYVQDGQIEYDGAPEIAIGKYLSTDKSDDAFWDDTDSKHKHLKQVTIGTEAKMCTNLVQYTETTQVKINLEQVNQLGIITAVRVTDVFGNILFTSWDRDSIEKRELNGSQSLVCNVPPHLLKPGSYTLTVFVKNSDSYEQALHEEVNLSFIVSSEQCDINNSRLGVISPLIKWEMSAQ